VSLPYIASPYLGRRRLTRVVSVGDVRMGGSEPIVVQSMTTTDTRDTLATADQVEQLADAGCEIVRVTAPSKIEAENLAAIKAELRRRGVAVPLVADIHFTPNAALIAARYVEKVRVNPGNYADKKKFETREYSGDEYGTELERVADRFRPLVRLCKERGVALRIGTNHGSLSDRIMNRYGDTSLGMVESALEFLDVCEDENFYEVVFSMKASNARVAIHAYRLLAARLEERAPGAASYPFHVGVTEAGDGADGRIKSAIGIGSLLEDGIGDTIRVSLTEDPVKEVPVARLLGERAARRWAEDRSESAPDLSGTGYCASPYAHARRPTKAVAAGGLDLGGDEPVRVELEVPLPSDPAAFAARLTTELATLGELPCEGLQVELPDAADLAPVVSLRSELRALGFEGPLALRTSPVAAASLPDETGSVASRLTIDIGADGPDRPDGARAGWAEGAAAAARLGLPLEWCLRAAPVEIPALVDAGIEAAKRAGVSGLLWSVDSSRALHAVRALALRLAELGVGDQPILLRSRTRGSGDSQVIGSAIDLGAPLCDGLGDAVSVVLGESISATIDQAYRILQGARLRTTRTEYISCPSCGRTLFDLEETTARVKEQTEHLKGVKIAVMGCIVNGPGEMADADYGYVGAGPGVVNLYVGKEIVERAVPESEAPARLLRLIDQTK